MSKPSRSIWFWQTILTPHMGSLAAALVKSGYDVSFVSNEIISKERLQLGWQKAKLGKARFILATNKNDIIRIVKKANKNSIHLCQGLWGNGLVSYAQKILRKRGLKYWIIIEKVDDRGWKGKLKRALYHLLFFFWQKYLEGVLAIGRGTKTWVIKRGINKTRVYPFAYFLKLPKINENKFQSNKKIKKRHYRFIFVGNLIKRKRIEILIKAVATLQLRGVIMLWIVGDGPEKARLQSLANLLLPKQVRWFGILPMPKIPEIISKTDCLVLPSIHDGWGAVTSEALMVGTPVICSNACGSSVAVKASKVGGVFISENLKSLTKILYKQYKIGKISITQRKIVSKWAKCLDANSGAKYLDLILNNTGNNLIEAPWRK
jgi:glycosyltransferase involved in cell wall biosynthesis